MFSYELESMFGCYFKLSALQIELKFCIHMSAL